jgi:LPXTG-site transpeptidase (sortase) family protein
MSPDPTARAIDRAPRALARFLVGLVLLAVATACAASGGEPDSTVSPRPVLPTTTASPTVTTGSPTPATTASGNQAGNSRKPEARQGKPVASPRTLRIPRIDVDARVVSVRTDEDRVLNPPEDPGVVGWWSEGAAPGERQGSAVLVGHTVRNHGGGVFDDIGRLARGDAIKVAGADSSLTYRVKSIDVLSKEELARQAEEIFNQTGPGRLVIITCDDWDGMAWRSNIITIADPLT